MKIYTTKVGVGGGYLHIVNKKKNLIISGEEIVEFVAINDKVIKDLLIYIEKKRKNKDSAREKFVKEIIENI